MESGGEPSESLKIKVSVLKVSIHCEGCKKKVYRILKNTAGVVETNIDALQNKVTVKAIVDADTLIKRLEKHGKHAEPWQDKKAANQNPSPSNNKSQNGNKENSKTKEKSENSDKKPAAQADGSASTASAAAAKPADSNKAEAELKPPAEPSKANSPEAKKETQKSEDKKAEASTAPAEKAAAAAAERATTKSDEKAAASGEASGNGGSGKKKGKKAQKESSEEAVTNNSDLTAGGVNPPIQHMYSYPPAYPPQPAYVMSYNMAHPSVSQAYYASPMPPAPQGYMYHPYPSPPPPEYYYGPSDGSSSSQPHHYDSMTMFSEENPNACNLM